MKNELRNILSGKSPVSFGSTLQAIACYLRESTQTSSGDKDTKLFKQQEKALLENYISQQNLWVYDIDFSQYISEGAEQKVYLKDGEYVFKLNDSIYYNTREDYFHNLMLHNYFFPDTAYELLGFTKESNVLYAVVKQKFVTITHSTDLQAIQSFMTTNGFDNIRNNDYFNPELGIILEDLHDENVLTQNGLLYFIDTVFYVTSDFWQD